MSATAPISTLVNHGFDAVQRRLNQYASTQITLTNQTANEQVIKLWGANQGSMLGNSLQSVNTGTYPQAILRNPFNSLLYVANQLDNSVTVFDALGTLRSTIILEDTISGMVSPVALEVNESTGYVFVAGSISNKVYVITETLELGAVIETEIRPVAMAFNPVNNLLYVLHLTGNTITVLDTINQSQVGSLVTGIDPAGICVSKTTGNVFIANAGSNSISQYDAANNALISIDNAGDFPIACAIDQTNRHLLVLAKNSAELLGFDSVTGSLEKRLVLNGEPDLLHQIPENGQYIVADSSTNKLWIVDSLLEVQLDIQLSNISSGLVYDPSSEAVFITAPLQNKVLLAYLGSGQGQAVTVSEDYAATVKDFQSNPAILKHVRAFFSGQNNSPVVKIGQRTPSGKEQVWVLSLGKYKSPQHRLNILDLYDLENEVIDGKTFWVLTLLPFERITLMLYYVQHQREGDMKGRILKEEKREGYEHKKGSNTVRPASVWD